MAFGKSLSERSWWILREYLEAAQFLALAGGCTFGLFFMQANGVEIPFWKVVLIYASTAVLALNGLMSLKVFFENAANARSAFAISIATMFLAPIVGGLLGALIVALIRSWAP